jgi:preprotein translocase subunit YajC
VNATALVFIIIVFGAVYVFLVLPQRRAQRAQKQMLSQLTPGTEVITTGGLHGTVTEIEDGDTVLLEVAEDTEVRVARASIARAITPAVPPPEADADTDNAETDSHDIDA